MTGDGYDAQVRALRKQEKRHKQNKRGTTVFAILTVLGWLLFLYKISQTSAYVMQYSRSAQESMGQWVMFLTLLTVVTGAMAWWTAMSGRKLRANADALKDGLRADLASAGEGDRARIESQLRELGA